MLVGEILFLYLYGIVSVSLSRIGFEKTVKLSNAIRTINDCHGGFFFDLSQI